MRSLRAGVVVGLACAIVALASCRAPTEVVIEARTSALAATVYPTFFTVGASARDVETAFVTASVSARPANGDGFLGSLVAVPGSSGDGAALSVKIALAFTPEAAARPDACLPPAYEGCIVARRTLRYVPHTRLVLPVELTEDCLNVPCDAVTTCRHGTCVDDTASCSGDTCMLPGESSSSPPPPPSPLDGGSDAPPPPPPPPNATDAGDAGDGGNASDGGVAGQIACFGQSCTVSAQVCCLDTGEGSCTGAGSCGAPKIGLICDDSDDCTTNQTCCANGSATGCYPGNGCPGGYVELCNDRGVCRNGTCSTTILFADHYPSCQ
jgi:hypothetical protein